MRPVRAFFSAAIVADIVDVVGCREESQIARGGKIKKFEVEIWELTLVRHVYNFGWWLSEFVPWRSRRCVVPAWPAPLQNITFGCTKINSGNPKNFTCRKEMHWINGDSIFLQFYEMPFTPRRSKCGRRL
jgi:hypothetical protein